MRSTSTDMSVHLAVTVLVVWMLVALADLSSWLLYVKESKLWSGCVISTSFSVISII